jgi:hypothetical protein
MVRYLASCAATGATMNSQINERKQCRTHCSPGGNQAWLGTTGQKVFPDEGKDSDYIFLVYYQFTVQNY